MSYTALLVTPRVSRLPRHRSNNPNVGDGVEMRKGVDWVLAENEREGSPLFGKVNPDGDGRDRSFAGRQRQLRCRGPSSASPSAPRSRVRASVHVPAAGDKIMLFFAGGADNIVPAATVREGYDICYGPDPYAELAGVGHFEPVPDGGDFRGPLTAWFRYHLMGEQEAGKIVLRRRLWPVHGQPLDDDEEEL